ncbi:hypothetical protein HYH03_008755 [Edaphochlamys debaryana]|uniref:Protein kinase domain-containing protein n=1 Tax=Edaphochlamys debaryana TaxID=47281 RepID=A0A836BYL4_9CHLO|nr:hypothetical protein HYH03_008755 [Edaphochlamys debaryana]|eukprot:KAG2493092.1 hypothetical protein HYH03_008755 [Edaphochlamys debaryana]
MSLSAVSAATARSGMPALSPAQLKAEVGELVYIGQGATGLVYRGTVGAQQAADPPVIPEDAGVASCPSEAIPVAVKFMICNTPQQLWQRAKEALLSKLVTHPNLVRTLAMDVTLVTQNTYREWGINPRLPRREASNSGANFRPGTSPSAGGDGAYDSAGAAAIAAVGGRPAAPEDAASLSAARGLSREVLSALSSGRGTDPGGAARSGGSHQEPAACDTPGRGGARRVLPSSHRALGPMMEVLGPGGIRGAAANRGIGGPRRSGGGGPHVAAGGKSLGLDPLEGCWAPHYSGGAGTASLSRGELSSADLQATPNGSGAVGGSSRRRALAGAGEVAAAGAAVAAAEVEDWTDPVPPPLGVNAARMVGAGTGRMPPILPPPLPPALGLPMGAPKPVSAPARPERAMHVAAGMNMRRPMSPNALSAAGMQGGGQHYPWGGALSSGSQSHAAATTTPASLGTASRPATAGAFSTPASLLSPMLAASPLLSVSASRDDSACCIGGTVVRGGTASCTLSTADGGPNGSTIASCSAGGTRDGKGSRAGMDPVPFQDMLYHLDALPGRFLAKVIMEYCDSGTLLQRINAGDFTAHPEAGAIAQLAALRATLWCLQEVAAGMAHLHSLNIIHGDLKPGNVLLTSEPSSPLGYVCKVSDFGLATALEASEQTITHENWGTVLYMAPESCAGRCRKASDVYSFGVLLWQMTTGQRPYAGLQAGQVLLGVKTGNLRLQWPAWANKSLVKVGQACLRFEPKERPGFKGIRSALAKVSARLDQKIAAFEAAGVMGSAALAAEAALAAAAGAEGVGEAAGAEMAGGSEGEATREALGDARLAAAAGLGVAAERTSPRSGESVQASAGG